MLGFNEFFDKLQKDLNEDLQTVGQTFALSRTFTPKANNASYDALSIQKGNISVSLNMTNAYKNYLSGNMNYAEVLFMLLKQSWDFLMNTPTFDVSSLLSFENVRQKLYLSVCQIAGNESFLEKIPYKQESNLALYCRIEVTPEASTVVNHKMLSEWKVDKKALFDAAYLSAEDVRPSVFKQMGEYLCEIDPYVFGEAARKDPTLLETPLYVLTNEQRDQGAASLFYLGMMEELVSRVEGSYYIIPSAIHEILILPERELMHMTCDDIDMMIAEINETQVDEREVLSGNVYHFDAQDLVFETGQEYEQRMQKKKEMEKDKRPEKKPEQKQPRL